MKIGLKRGDVVLVPFPNSDLRTAKLRPAIIVQANHLKTGLPQIILAMVSTNLNRNGHYSRVLIAASSKAGKESGLLFDSIVMCDNLATISLTSIQRVIGHLSNKTELNDALKHTLGLHGGSDGMVINT